MRWAPPPDVDLPEGVTLESRVAELEARITSLGPINPLALEELAALEERYKELDAQVSDVRHARREFQEVIRALDEEIMQTFSSAVADVNEHFSSLIAMLFPGGQGRLIMTEPDDPLNTGVEIEVRPMGRNVRRISLLSGGERSMAALAFLFAVFRSRPSPFYMMDEVEAALDDVNLQRFLSLVDEFRDEAQLLIVTHQKRTMEVGRRALRRDHGPGRIVQGGQSARQSHRGKSKRRDRPLHRLAVVVVLAGIGASWCGVVAVGREFVVAPPRAAMPDVLVQRRGADAGHRRRVARDPPRVLAQGLRSRALAVGRRAASATSSSTSSKRCCCAVTWASPRPTCARRPARKRRARRGRRRAARDPARLL